METLPQEENSTALPTALAAAPTTSKMLTSDDNVVSLNSGKKPLRDVVEGHVKKSRLVVVSADARYPWWPGDRLPDIYLFQLSGAPDLWIVGRLPSTHPRFVYRIAIRPSVAAGDGDDGDSASIVSENTQNNIALVDYIAEARIDDTAVSASSTSSTSLELLYAKGTLRKRKYDEATLDARDLSLALLFNPSDVFKLTKRLRRERIVPNSLLYAFHSCHGLNTLAPRDAARLSLAPSAALGAAQSAERIEAWQQRYWSALRRLEMGLRAFSTPLFHHDTADAHFIGALQESGLMAPSGAESSDAAPDLAVERTLRESARSALAALLSRRHDKWPLSAATKALVNECLLADAEPATHRRPLEKSVAVLLGVKQAALEKLRRATSVENRQERRLLVIESWAWSTMHARLSCDATSRHSFDGGSIECVVLWGRSWHLYAFLEVYECVLRPLGSQLRQLIFVHEEATIINTLAVAPAKARPPHTNALYTVLRQPMKIVADAIGDYLKIPAPLPASFINGASSCRLTSPLRDCSMTALAATASAATAATAAEEHAEWRRVAAPRQLPVTLCSDEPTLVGMLVPTVAHVAAPVLAQRHVELFYGPQLSTGQATADVARAVEAFIGDGHSPQRHASTRVSGCSIRAPSETIQFFACLKRTRRALEPLALSLTPWRRRCPWRGDMVDISQPSFSAAANAANAATIAARRADGAVYYVTEAGDVVALRNSGCVAKPCYYSGAPVDTAVLRLDEATRRVDLECAASAATRRLIVLATPQEWARWRRTNL